MRAPHFPGDEEDGIGLTDVDISTQESSGPLSAAVVRQRPQSAFNVGYNSLGRPGGSAEQPQLPSRGALGMEDVSLLREEVVTKTGFRYREFLDAHHNWIVGISVILLVLLAAGIAIPVIVAVGNGSQEYLQSLIPPPPPPYPPPPGVPSAPPPPPATPPPPPILHQALCNGVPAGDSITSYVYPHHYQLDLQLLPEHFEPGLSMTGGSFRASSLAHMTVLQDVSCVVLDTAGIDISSVTFQVAGEAVQCVCGGQAACLVPSCSAAVYAPTVTSSQTGIGSADGLAGGAATPPSASATVVNFQGLVAPANTSVYLTFNYTARLQNSTQQSALWASLPYTFAMAGEGGAAGPSITEVMLSTQCEPSSARALLPCLDEPAIKTLFYVTVDAPSYMTARSNMPATSTEPSPSIVGNTLTTFPPTPTMSTYLLAVAVGRLEEQHVAGVASVDGSNKTLSVWTLPGRTGLAELAFQVATASYAFYEDFTATAQPLSKFDLIAVPGKGGAMENWGILMFDEDRFLTNTTLGGAWQTLRTADIVCHEMAHQWFGNLVTCSTWRDLLVNEGLASFMEYKCIAAALNYTSEAVLRHWYLGAMGEAPGSHDGYRSRAQEAEEDPAALPMLPSPASNASSSSAVVYSKGAAVLALLEANLEQYKAGAMQAGLRQYLTLYAYASASVETFLELMVRQLNATAVGGGDASAASEQAGVLYEGILTWMNQAGSVVVYSTANAVAFPPGAPPPPPGLPPAPRDPALPGSPSGQDPGVPPPSAASTQPPPLTPPPPTPPRAPLALEPPPLTPPPLTPPPFTPPPPPLASELPPPTPQPLTPPSAPPPASAPGAARRLLQDGTPPTSPPPPQDLPSQTPATESPADTPQPTPPPLSGNSSDLLPPPPQPPELLPPEPAAPASLPPAVPLSTDPPSPLRAPPPKPPSPSAPAPLPAALVTSVDLLQRRFCSWGLWMPNGSANGSAPGLVCPNATAASWWVPVPLSDIAVEQAAVLLPGGGNAGNVTAVFNTTVPVLATIPAGSSTNASHELSAPLGELSWLLGSRGMFTLYRAQYTSASALGGVHNGHALHLLAQIQGLNITAELIAAGSPTTAQLAQRQALLLDASTLVADQARLGASVFGTALSPAAEDGSIVLRAVQAALLSPESATGLGLYLLAAAAVNALQPAAVHLAVLTYTPANDSSSIGLPCLPLLAPFIEQAASPLVAAMTTHLHEFELQISRGTSNDTDDGAAAAGPLTWLAADYEVPRASDGFSLTAQDAYLYDLSKSRVLSQLALAGHTAAAELACQLYANFSGAPGSAALPADWRAAAYIAAAAQPPGCILPVACVALGADVNSTAGCGPLAVWQGLYTTWQTTADASEAHRALYALAATRDPELILVTLAVVTGLPPALLAPNVSRPALDFLASWDPAPSGSSGGARAAQRGVSSADSVQLARLLATASQQQPMNGSAAPPVLQAVKVLWPHIAASLGDSVAYALLEQVVSVTATSEQHWIDLQAWLDSTLSANGTAPSAAFQADTASRVANRAKTNAEYLLANAVAICGFLSSGV